MEDNTINPAILMLLNSNSSSDSESDTVEEEQVDESIVLMDKPFDPTKINIETKTPSLDTLIKRISHNSIQMDTEKYFQRQDDLWNTEKQSRLIESILIRLPLPAFFFDATNDNEWLVVDGLQRLSSIRNFCVLKDNKKQLRLTNLEFLSHLNGETFDSLPADLQRIIEEAQVVIYKIMPGTPTDVKFNIFKRINTGGLVLSAQEIRHALFQGKPSVFIAELAKNENFLKATDSKIKTHRMLDRDFANRFLCFYLFGYNDYNSDLDTFMSKAMASIKDKTDDELTKIKIDFNEAMILSYEVFGNKAFRKNINDNHLSPINKALFDAISTQFAKLTSEQRDVIKLKKNQFYSNLKFELSTDEAFFVSITSSTGDKKRVIKRHTTIQQLIKLVINN